MDEKITGTIKQAALVNYDPYLVVTGIITGDANGRFRDGDFVRTSYVKRIVGNKVYTRNSVYLIDGPLIVRGD